MVPNGFLVLLQRHLLHEFRRDSVLKAKNWLFSFIGSKIIVHGTNREALGDTDILAEITSCPKKTWICVELKANGTTADRALLAKIIGDWAQNSQIIFNHPEE